jgi:glutamate-1-semialdehyde 2,1-aminomutase
MTLNATVRRSLDVFPAGSNGEFNLPAELSIVIDKGKGPRLWDTSGREFLDFSMGWGSVLTGHANERIVEAVARQLSRGSNFAYVNGRSLELAEEICRVSTCCEQIRFCASGTEATMYCLRLARAVTGRDKILKFEGAYHGANEAGVSSLFPAQLLEFPNAEASSKGLTDSMLADVLVAPYNDLNTASRIIEEHAGQLAAVIVEPLQRCTPPRRNFLQGLRAVTSQSGVPLVFDEVVTGFRLAYGGAQEYYGVVPDLVAYGKALGGGYPIGAFGGSRELMSWMREDRLGSPDYMWMASSIGGNPISCSAALAALELFREPHSYAHLHEQGEYLRSQLRSVLESRNQVAQVIGDGPLAQVVFSARPVFDYRSTHRGDKKKARRLMLRLFEKGIFLNPMGTKLYLSLAHDKKDADEFMQRFDDVLSEPQFANLSII